MTPKQRGGWRLTLEDGRRYGPTFRTQAEAEEFKHWLEARTGIGWEHQNEKTLELLAQDFRRQR